MAMNLTLKRAQYKHQEFKEDMLSTSHHLVISCIQLETKYWELCNLGPMNMEPMNFYGFSLYKYLKNLVKLVCDGMISSAHPGYVWMKLLLLHILARTASCPA